MIHCELDLETLHNVPGGIILSIGAVMFDPTKPPHNCLGEEFYCVVGQPTCEAAGLTASADTLAWWEKQSPEARKVLTQAQNPMESISLSKALDELAAFLPKDCKVWSNGANFDQPFLAVAYERLGKKLPWDFWNGRCHRTIIALHPSEKALRPRTVLAHNALEDAKWQARHLVNIAQALELKL